MTAAATGSSGSVDEVPTRTRAALGRGCVKTRRRQTVVGQNGAHIASRAVQVECAHHVEREHHSRVGKNVTLVSEFGVFTQPYMDTARFAKLIVM